MAISRIFTSLTIVISSIHSLSKRHCFEDDFRFGQWIQGAHNCGLLDNYTVNSKWLPGAQLLTEASWPWSKYCWKPIHCDATSFSPSLICDVLHGQDILFVGDSVHFELFTAFVYQMGEVLTFDQWAQGRIHLCDGNVTAGFIRNDHLRVKKEDENVPHVHNSNQFWKHMLPMTDILILSKGHHVNRFEVHHDGSFEKDTIRTVEYLKLYANEISIYFITTSPGHVNCSKDSKVNTSILYSTPKYITSDELPISMKHYLWDSFEKNDIFICDLLKRELNATIVHITPSSFLRPDDHRWNLDGSSLGADCLHHRLPGVPDSWVYMLSNLLYMKYLYNGGRIAHHRRTRFKVRLQNTSKYSLDQFGGLDSRPRER